uniref:Uncharacterized protein n=1 Tax=Parascaris univalens TaxID=6257 RepID=A0A915BA92_PARUN
VCWEFILCGTRVGCNTFFCNISTSVLFISLPLHTTHLCLSFQLPFSIVASESIHLLVAFNSHPQANTSPLGILGKRVLICYSITKPPLPSYSFGKMPFDDWVHWN